MINVRGKILFDPIDYTKKHEKQSSWKRIAMVMLDGELCEYYSWFIKKRYRIRLNIPLRKAHISFINDSTNDILKGLNVPEEALDLLWNNFKEKWDNKEIDIVLDPNARSDGNHWWLNIPEEERILLHSIRKEIGLERPFFGLHMSIGYANPNHLEHSNYIVGLVSKYGGAYN